MRGNHYFLDTSALVAAWEERYPIVLFPEVWDFINSMGNRVRVCEEVRDEVERHAEGLLPWLDSSSVESRLSLSALGQATSGEVQRRLGRIANGWPNWRAVRIGNAADPWIIAYAYTLGGVVVSEEQRGGNDVRIPDVCAVLDVRHMSLLDLFRTEGFRKA